MCSLHTSHCDIEVFAYRLVLGEDKRLMVMELIVGDFLLCAFRELVIPT